MTWIFDSVGGSAPHPCCSRVNVTETLTSFTPWPFLSTGRQACGDRFPACGFQGGTQAQKGTGTCAQTRRRAEAGQSHAQPWPGTGRGATDYAISANGLVLTENLGRQCPGRRELRWGARMGRRWFLSCRLLPGPPQGEERCFGHPTPPQPEKRRTLSWL